MARSFNPLRFLRTAPNYLLEEYFRRRGLLTDFNWENCSEREVEAILDAVTRIDDEDLQDDIMGDFQELHARTRDGGFVKAILDEAGYHGIDPDLSERFDAMKSHLERALWVYLHRKGKYWDGAHVIWRVDKITSANQWISRPDLPARPGPVDESVVEELRRALIRYFTKSEARGRRCKVEAFRRGAEEIFYCYPEDYKQTVSEYVGDNLEPRTLQPAFEIVFRHVDVEGKLDIHVEGDVVSANILQVVFASAVLKEDIEEEYDETRATYSLQPLLSASFDFSCPEGTSISDVFIKLMRFKIEGEDRFRRVTLEADPTGNPQAIYELFKQAAGEFSLDDLTIDQIVLRVVFKKEPRDRRTPTRTVVLTAPHTCRMTHDQRGEQIHKMLVASGIEIAGGACDADP